MSFREIDEKDQRDLAEKYIREGQAFYDDDPRTDMSNFYGPRGLSVDQMIEWLKAQDDVDPMDTMRGLAKEGSLRRSATPLLDGIRKAASSDKLKKVEKRLGIYLQDPEAREYALQLRSQGLSSKKVMRELIRKYPKVADARAQALEAQRAREAAAYEAETARMKATQAERTAAAIGTSVIGAVGVHNLTKPSKSYSSYSSGPGGTTRESYRRW